MISIKTLEINSQPFLINTNIEEDFLRGSLWENLYSFYKYKANSYKPKNEFDKQVYALQIYTFIGIELAQYISTHPNDKQAFEMLKRINADKNKIKDYIETNDAALSHCSTVLDGYFTLSLPWGNK